MAGWAWFVDRLAAEAAGTAAGPLGRAGVADAAVVEISPVVVTTPVVIATIAAAAGPTNHVDQRRAPRPLPVISICPFTCPESAGQNIAQGNYYHISSRGFCLLGHTSTVPPSDALDARPTLERTTGFEPATLTLAR